MKTEYKHIFFEQDEEICCGKPTFNCVSNKDGDILGVVHFYRPWKKVVFEGWPEAVFDTSCLKDIINFMEQLQ